MFGMCWNLVWRVGTTNSETFLSLSMYDCKISGLCTYVYIILLFQSVCFNFLEVDRGKLLAC